MGWVTVRGGCRAIHLPPLSKTVSAGSSAASVKTSVRLETVCVACTVLRYLLVVLIPTAYWYATEPRVSASSMIDHAIPPYSVRARVPRAMYYTDYSDSATRLYIAYRNVMALRAASGQPHLSHVT